MKFFAYLLAITFSSSLTLPLQVGASVGITGYTAKTCEGDSGANVICEGECINFFGRNAFTVGSDIRIRPTKYHPLRLAHAYGRSSGTSTLLRHRLSWCILRHSSRLECTSSFRSLCSLWPYPHHHDGYESMGEMLCWGLRPWAGLVRIFTLNYISSSLTPNARTYIEWYGKMDSTEFGTLSSAFCSLYMVEI